MVGQIKSELEVSLMTLSDSASLSRILSRRQSSEANAEAPRSDDLGSVSGARIALYRKNVEPLLVRYATATISGDVSHNEIVEELHAVVH